MAYGWLNSFRNYLLRLNLFKTRSSNGQNIVVELLATRIYIISLIFLVLGISISAGWLGRTITEIQYSPSLNNYLNLEKNFPRTLKCRCSNIGVSYERFVKTNVTFHQVCSSQFVTQQWIDSVFINTINMTIAASDVRYHLSYFWQIVAGLCSLTNNTWNDVIMNFGSLRVFSPYAMIEEVIRSQALEELNNQISLSKKTLMHNFLFIRRITTENQFISALGTNFYLGYLNSSENSLRMLPVKTNNCSCLNSDGCPQSAFINNSRGEAVLVSGMVVDCFIVDATLASTLECYYDHNCFSMIHEPFIATVNLLSNNSNKHFRIDSTVEAILNDLMIDQLNVDITYSAFYSQCKPYYCTYSYSQHFSPIFIITIIIGIFGSLSFVLRLISPFIAEKILHHNNQNMSNQDNVQNNTSIKYFCEY